MKEILARRDKIVEAIEKEKDALDEQLAAAVNVRTRSLLEEVVDCYDYALEHLNDITPYHMRNRED